MSPERVSLARALYCGGEKIDYIALVVGVSRLSVMKWARKGGWVHPARQKTTDRMAEAQSRYAAGEKINDIAARLHINRETVFAWARKSGWQRPSIATMREWRWLNRSTPT